MRHAIRSLTTLVVFLATSPVTVAAQNPIDALRKAASDAKKRADEIKRVADSTKRANDSTRRAVTAAKASADSAKSAVEGAARSATTSSPVTQPATTTPTAASRGGTAGTSAPSPTRSAPVVPNADQGRSTARVEEHILVTGESGLSYEVSPRGQHVAAVVLRGSRMVMVHDGTEGPRFDELLLIPGTGTNSKVVFSSDGSRHAYVGRQGQEWVVMLDGKELARGSPWSQSNGATTITSIGFAPGDKHFYFTTLQLNTTRPVARLYLDGIPGPASEEDIRPLFSANGERHAYVVTGRDRAENRVQQLILDGKPSPYPGGEPEFTSDGLHVFTRMPVRGADGIDIYADGKPFMRVPSASLHFAPSGSAVLGVVWTPFQNGARHTFLTIANRRVPGSECRGNAGIDRVYFSNDARHWAVRCQDSNSSYWVMADGKKGRDYQSISGSVEFLADGRPVYAATQNGRYFVVVGEEELGPYMGVQVELPPGRSLQAAPEMRSVVVSGNRYGFIAQMAPGNARLVIVDGKSSPGETTMSLTFSPDGSRYAHVNSRQQQVVLDGTQALEPPLEHMPRSGAPLPFAFSPDGKHIAYASYPVSGAQGRGVAIDNKLFMTETTQNFGVTFSPDSRHLAWIGQRPGVNKQVIYIDGEPVLEVDQTRGLQDVPQVYTAMGADGVFTVVAQHGGAIKRFRITPGSSSVETMLAKAVKP